MVKEMLLRALNFCSADRLQVTLETQATVLEAFHKIFVIIVFVAMVLLLQSKKQYNIFAILHSTVSCVCFLVIVWLRHTMTTIHKTRKSNFFLSGCRFFHGLGGLHAVACRASTIVPTSGLFVVQLMEKNPANQLRLAVYLIHHRGLYILDIAGFLSSTVSTASCLSRSFQVNLMRLIFQ